MRHNKSSYKGIFFQLILCVFSIFIIIIFTYKWGYFDKKSIAFSDEVKGKSQGDNKKLANNNKISADTNLVISSVGDCTIGTDSKFDESTSLTTVVKNHDNDYGYLFKNSLEILKNDDITTANLETVFTKSEIKADKEYTFKAPPEFAKSLQLGSIEGVNVSNNHTYDFLDKGFQDTIDALKKYKVGYFGYGNRWIRQVKGIKVGFLGYTGWSYSDDLKSKIKEDIDSLKGSGCSAVIINFHWGNEGSYYPNSIQKNLAHYAVDCGADLVVGHHPHVIQGIEKYKGKIIAYSLGNFCFGGNSNPRDKDTLVLQTKFHFKSGKLSEYYVRAIPFSISSVKYINDYCPTPLKDNDKTRVLNKINNFSANFGFRITDSFESVTEN